VKGLRIVGVLGATFLIATAAVAQPVVDSVVFEQGQELYQNHCALCHQDAGTGNPPTFPSLSGNDHLEDPAQIVRTIRQGAGTMPPFPDLSTAEISAVATYIRNAWANSFGAITTAEATAALDVDGFEAEGDSASVWDGVFTETQAERGRAAYPGACALCHGRRLNGAPDDPDMAATPSLARARFLRTWDGKSLATLFEYTRATMPQDNPGSLTDEEYVDVIAYMLSVGGMPAGEVDLQPDPEDLARVVIEPQP
jgi:mono/diheme cytochrome c family protein